MSGFRLDLDDEWRIENDDGLNWVVRRRTPRKDPGKDGETHRDSIKAYCTSLSYALTFVRDRLLAEGGKYSVDSLLEAIRESTDKLAASASEVLDGE